MHTCFQVAQEVQRVTKRWKMTSGMGDLQQAGLRLTLSR